MEEYLNGNNSEDNGYGENYPNEYDYWEDHYKRKVFRILKITGLVIAAVILLKNFVLYYGIYHFDVKYLAKVEGEFDAYNAGTYTATVDFFGNSEYDSRRTVSVVFVTDSTGIYTVDDCFTKVKGHPARSFSISSFVPYRDSSDHSAVLNFKVCDGYLKIKKDNNEKIVEDPADPNGLLDSTYVKYKIEGDKLYLDKWGDDRPYDRKPEWGFAYNQGPALWVLLEPKYLFGVL